MSQENQVEVELVDTDNAQNGRNHIEAQSASSINNSPIASAPISVSVSPEPVTLQPTEYKACNIQIQSGMEKASLLIIGYIRRERLKNKKDINIPLEVISIITVLYPKMNGKLFCWHINDDNIIKNFINAKHKQRFASDIFEMKNLKWYLSAYPNGDRKEGSCTVYLTLISFPSNWSKFICNYSIYCNQTRSSATYITTYTEKRSQSGRIAGLLSIKEIKKKYINKQLNAITFSVNVNILQIYDKLNKKLIYQYNLLNNKQLLLSKYVMIWHVNKFMVNEFLKSDAIKQYETDVYYDMFCLAFCPNGGWKENEGQARLSLKLCCLPNKISKIKVKMELECVETETYYSDICDFGYDSKNTVRAWPSDILLTPQLNGLNKLTFKCMIFIIAKYDQNGNEIIDHNQIINDDISYINDDYNHNHNDNDDGDDDVVDDNDIDGVHQQNQLSMDSVVVTTNNTMNNVEIQSQIKQIMTMLDSLNNQINNIQSILNNNNNNHHHQFGQNGNSDHDIKQNDDNHDKQEQVKYFMNHILGMGEYYQLFIKNGLDDMDIIKQLTMNELLSIGIKKLGHRKKIKQAIDNLNNLKISNIFWKIYNPKKIN